MEGPDMDISNISWIGHASFRIDDAPGCIYIDPWKLPNDLPPADLILLTHTHFDHLSAEDIAAITTPSTTLVGPQSVADALASEVTVVGPDDVIAVAGWTIQAVAAYNIGKDFHKRSEGWVGYIVTLSDGTRLYHAGDTDATDEVRNVRADIALLPCGGTYTMTAAEVVMVANICKPGILVPMHWGDIVGTRADAEAVLHGYAQTVILEPMRPPTTP